MTTAFAIMPVVPIASIESWLHEQTAATLVQPILWCPHGWRQSGEAVRNLEGSVALFDRGPPQGERSGRSGMSDRVPEFVGCGGQPEHRFGVDRELVLVAV